MNHIEKCYLKLASVNTQAGIINICMLVKLLVRKDVGW